MLGQLILKARTENMDPNNINKKNFLQAFVKSMLFTTLLAVYTVTIFVQRYGNISAWFSLFILTLTVIVIYLFVFNFSLLKIQRITGYLSREQCYDIATTASNMLPKGKALFVDNTEPGMWNRYTFLMFIFGPAGFILCYLLLIMEQCLAVLLIKDKKLNNSNLNIDEKQAEAWCILFIVCLWIMHPDTCRALYALIAGLILLIISACGINLSYVTVLAYGLCGYGLYEGYRAWKNL